MGGPGSGNRYPVRKRKKPVHTNYYLAFEQYKQTKEYRRAVRMFVLHGMHQPHIENWLRSIFGDGFIASGVEIKTV